jgi:MOSC domain-containing protein YiiM
MSDSDPTPGRLEAIWLKRARGAPMDPQPSAVLDERGLLGNANRGHRRAVTIIEREVFDRVRAELSDRVRPDMRRANLMISGLPLEGSRGRLLEIGAVRIRIGGETRPCELMDEEGHPGLRLALQPGWGGGAYGTVERPGEIAVGDAVRWAE